MTGKSHIAELIILFIAIYIITDKVATGIIYPKQCIIASIRCIGSSITGAAHIYVSVLNCNAGSLFPTASAKVLYPFLVKVLIKLSHKQLQIENGAWLSITCGIN